MNVNELRDYLKNLTEEEKEEIRRKYFPEDRRPKGWVSIEAHLPMMMVKDITQGYSVYKVKDEFGNEFETRVCDHNTWYYHAKEIGITHWYNE